MSKEDFDTESQYREQLFKELIEIVGELGWSVAIPKGADNEEVPGLIIGSQEYLDRIASAVDRVEKKSGKRS